MANKLSQQKIDEMWAAWQETQNSDYVSKKVGVSWKSVEKYRKSERWEERWAAIKEKANASADNEVAKRRASQIKLIQAAVATWAQCLTGKKKVECPHCNKEYTVVIPGVNPKLSDIDKLIRLENYVKGEPDQRTETHFVVEYVE